MSDPTSSPPPSAGVGAVAWPRRTERLLLRAALDTDLEFCWRVRTTGSVSRWLTEGPGELDTFLERAREVNRVETTMIVELDGVPIGDLMLRISDGWAQSEVKDLAVGVQAELGWTFDPAYGGQGYATEAVAELVRICFEELGLLRLLALCFAENTPSWTLMERLGMRREAHNVRDSLHRDLGWIDGFVYAQLADEWRAAQGA